MARINYWRNMTKKMLVTPKHWLTLGDSKILFETFRKHIGEEEPIPEFDTRFKDRLEGILESVRQSFSGDFLNPTILDAAAAYFNQIIRGHPFRNGNKRMGVLFTHFFLLQHGCDLTLYYNELFTFAVMVARAGEMGIAPDTTKKWCIKVLREFTEERK